MISVKQYAEERGITIQAVHQSMNGKRKKSLLEGHVHMVDGVKWLDEAAVDILDMDRRKPPVLFERDDANARIKELEENERVMLAKIAAQADRISELAQWKADNAVAIAEASQTKLLLEDARKDAAAQAVELGRTQQEVDRLRAELEEVKQRETTLKSRNLLERIFRKGE